ncbi:MAG: serine/threonine-protein kinase [Planctomycetaceae bacterium]
MKRFPQLDTPQRMERLVSAEIACRLQIHAAIDPDHYRQRFPDLIADNSWVHQRVDAIQRLGKSIRRSRSERTVTPWQTADTDAAPGLRSFGDYELLQEIARGGMGVVYKARQTKLNRVVALKMILSGQLASPEDVQRFYVEAEAAASLEHPGIVPIYEIGEHDHQHFFSMGFIEGASLESQVKDGPLPPREAATVTQRVSEAIAYAHAQGVIHRDLKPANILIDTGGEPKVTDFGLAKKTEGDSGLTGTGQILGTPGYMPPEQASGETDTIGPAADIYSLGAILYALLTGRPPFQSATVMDTLVAVLEQEPVTPRQLNPALDVDLETICLKCLQKDIKRRYTTTDELVAELGRYLNGEPIHARPIGKLERGWRWCKRKPALAGMLGISAAALMVLVAGGLWYNAQLVQERDIAQRQRKLAEMREAEATLAQANEARQRERAEEQKEAAERNFKLARMAVGELTTISQNELFDVPQMEPIRKALLEKARAFYETFVEQSTGDRDLMYELAKAHERLGSIIQQLGNPADAAAEYEKSRLAFSQLLNDHKDVPLYALDLAYSYNNLANTQSELGKKQRAIELYEKEILILYELWRDHPNVPDYAASLATSYNNLAIVQSDLGQVDKAVEWYNKALGIQVELLKTNPREGEYAEDLARSYHNLGQQYGELGQNDRAIKLYTKAIQIKETLFKRNPNVSKYADNLASTYFALACTQRDVGKTEKFFSKCSRRNGL